MDCNAALVAGHVTLLDGGSMSNAEELMKEIAVARQAAAVEAERNGKDAPPMNCSATAVRVEGRRDWSKALVGTHSVGPRVHIAKGSK
jgi:hypothetical protein